MTGLEPIPVIRLFWEFLTSWLSGRPYAMARAQLRDFVQEQDGGDLLLSFVVNKNTYYLEKVSLLKDELTLLEYRGESVPNSDPRDELWRREPMGSKKTPGRRGPLIVLLVLVGIALFAYLSWPTPFPCPDSGTMSAADYANLNTSEVLRCFPLGKP